jgi:hypothetical protein
MPSRTFNTPGAGTYPAATMAADGVIAGTVLSVQLWGAGSAGTIGAGAWGQGSYTVTSGDVASGISLSIGTGTNSSSPGTGVNTWFKASTTLQVLGGNGTGSNVGLTSGPHAGGTRNFAGGGAGGPDGAGQNATGGSGAGKGDAGLGGAGGAEGATGSAGGSNPLGGGGGGFGTSGAGGNGGNPGGGGASGTPSGVGGNGQIILSWTTATNVNPGSGSLVFTGKSPTIALGNTLNPSTGSVVFAGKQPTITMGLVVNPAAGGLIFTGLAPTITLAPAPPAPATPSTTAHDAGPSAFGGWFNLAFKSGQSRRRKRATDIGRELDALAYAEEAHVSRATLAPEVAKRTDEVVEQAVAALRRDTSVADDAAALRRVAAHEIAFARLREQQREDARQAFIAAIVERATREYIQEAAEQRRRRVARDDADILMLMELA